MPDQKHQELFQLLVRKYVEQSDRNMGWMDTYAQGVFNSYVIVTGKPVEGVLEELHEAVDDYRQRLHDEMIYTEGEH